jgi:putative oxidoreductase
MIARLFSAHAALGRRLERVAEPLFNLAVRFWMARIFFDAGLLRVANWEKQADLFETIHPVPGVPPQLAALVTTAAELALPVLLMLGILTRLPALAMLAMTLVIQFVVGATPQGIENGIANPQHYLWMLLLGYLVIRGGGPFSIDRLATQIHR